MITIKRKDWDNPTIRNAVLSTAEVLGEDVEVIYPKPKFKPYNVQIWLNDCDVEEKDFSKKSQALKWIKQRLSLKKYVYAFADLKKYNKTNDDFDWSYYKMTDGKLVEKYSLEEEIDND